MSIKCGQLIYLALFNFIIRYRKTFLGPIWIVIGPSVFIGTLGLLFSRIGNVDSKLLIPHLSVGLILWTLVSGFIVSSTAVFQRSRSQILQGSMSVPNIVMMNVFSTIIQFLHQVIIVVVVFALTGTRVSLYSLISFIGLGLLIANGVWLTYLFGIIGTRYRDLTEVVQPLMRIAFLATPIIWMPGLGDRGGVLGAYLVINPFYHFLEIVRAPLLGNSVNPLSWIVVLSITGVGFALTRIVNDRFARNIPLWV